MVVSGRTCLRIYCVSLGLTSSFTAFLWSIFQIYLLYTTASDQNDLMVARYLDISFGLLGLSSSLALLYGAFVESKTWLTVWTLGSTTLIIGRWAWFFYQKYWIVHPESLKEAQKAGMILSGIYIILIIPVLINYKYLESNHLSFSEWLYDISQGKLCRSILGPCCVMFSSDYFSDIRQVVCTSEENNVRSGNEVTNPREVFDCREDQSNLVLHWDPSQNENNVKNEKIETHVGRSYRYTTSSKCNALERPKGKM